MLVHITNRKPENQYIITITLNVSQFGVHKAASIAWLNSPKDSFTHFFSLSQRLTLNLEKRLQNEIKLKELISVNFR